MRNPFGVAEQLISQDRVHLYTVDNSDIVAIVDGEDGIRGVSRAEARWSCTCSKPIPCEHSLAVALAVAVSQSSDRRA